MLAHDKFHAHLDQCQRCEERPHELCAIGARLLQEAAQQACPFWENPPGWDDEPPPAEPKGPGS